MEDKIIYVVYINKGTDNWIRDKEFDNLKDANKRAKQMFYLLGWKEVKVQKEKRKIF
jgi:hypothetical protein